MSLPTIKRVYKLTRHGPTPYSHARAVSIYYRLGDVKQAIRGHTEYIKRIGPRASDTTQYVAYYEALLSRPVTLEVAEVEWRPMDLP